jgi:hypothetical protein
MIKYEKWHHSGSFENGILSSILILISQYHRARHVVKLVSTDQKEYGRQNTIFETTKMLISSADSAPTKPFVRNRYYNSGRGVVRNPRYETLLAAVKNGLIRHHFLARPKKDPLVYSSEETFKVRSNTFIFFSDLDLTTSIFFFSFCQRFLLVK